MPFLYPGVNMQNNLSSTHSNPDHAGYGESFRVDDLAVASPR